MPNADLLAALANADLGEFEGDPVLGTTIDCPNIGGGFGMALAIDPVIMHRGDRVKILIDAEVVSIGHPPVKDGAGVKRLHRLSAVAATFVEGDVFDEALKVQAEKIQAAKDAASGQGTITDALALQAEHDDGQHASGLVDGCPACVEERELAEAGS